MKYLNKQILEAIQKGINLAVDDFDDLDTTLEVQKKARIKDNVHAKDILFMRENFVDLDLPSGTWWGKYNIGVNPNELNIVQDWYGGYYAWGEIKEKLDYSWTTYKYANGNWDKLTKYCTKDDYLNKNSKLDSLTILQDEDDVAVQTNKLPWNIKMPTKKQFDELLKYTTNKWIKNYQGIIGLNGRIFTSKTNGNQMFIPAAGAWAGSSGVNNDSNCRLWSSNLFQSTQSDAYLLTFGPSWCSINANYRCFGFNVRAVLNLK